MVNVKNITYSYNNSEGNILENIFFNVEAGECLGVLGNNGTGKSTLLKCLNGICYIKDGGVFIDGENVLNISRNKMAQKIAYVSQHNEISEMTVFDAVLLGRKPYITWAASVKDIEIVDNIINEIGLENVQLKNINELSGGQVQKVMLARALAQQPKFLLLDEPTSSLDLKNQHEVLRTIKRISKEHNISVVLVIHDLNLALRFCDKFLFLKDTKIFSYGGLETVTPELIYDVYGVQTEIIEHNNKKIIITT